MKRLTALLFIVFLVAFNVSAAISDYHITHHYTSQNGLPQNSAKGIELDKDRFLWIGTESGLVRFNGQRFNVYAADHFPLLKSNRIRSMALDTAGVVCFVDESWAKLTFDNKGRTQQITDKAYLGRIARFQKDSQ